MAHPVPSSTLDIEMAISVAARTIGSRTLARPGGLWAMLFARLLLFAGWQGVFVVAFAVSGSTRPLQDSAAWWLITATLANLTNLGMLGWLTHREGRKLRSLLNFDRSTWRRDLLWGGGSLLVLVPLGVFPGPLLGTALFGNASVPTSMLFQPLPGWALIFVGVMFPLTIALSELPTYYGYVMPGLKKMTGLVWPIVLLVGTTHALQHVTLPRLLDPRFMAWRFGMFLPFALFIAWLISRRPSLLPYLMAVHFLLDAQLVFLVPR